MSAVIDAPQASAVAGRRFYLFNGKNFKLCVVAATIMPLCVAAVVFFSAKIAGLLPAPINIVFRFGTFSAAMALTVMGTLSAAHVMSTSYLLFNPSDYRGVWRPAISLAAIPALLFFVTFAVLLFLPLWAVLAYMLAYLHFGMFHFGRQNLGVLTFVSRISLHRPISTFERRTIMAGVIAGVFATYSIFAPALGLNPKAFPFDVSRVTPIFSLGWYVGAAINVVLVPTTLWYAIAHRRDYDSSTLIAWLASVFFFLPMFLTANPLFALSAWTVAHGLQYLVFLLFHAAGKRQPLLPVIFLSAAVGAGIVIWRISASVQASDAAEAIKIAVATITAITLVHYWVDQFLWKLGAPERRKWFADNYSFLFQK
jgi:hypothetical protein